MLMSVVLLLSGGLSVFVKFGSWVFYFGFNGFYVERLCSLHFFFGVVNYRRL